MKVLIVDDEPLARDRLQRLLAELDDYEVVGAVSDGEQAVQCCHRTQAEIVLMDIRMPVMDGLNAARALALLEQPPAVVFCTAYDEYAVQAFDANAVGYLLKPVNRDKLAAALAKASRPNRAQLAAVAAPEARQRSHISAKTHRGIELVPVADIRYFQADQKYVTVVHTGGQLLIDETLKELEEEFGERFVRVHRSALAAVAHIQGLDRDEDKQYRLRLADIERGPQVSRRHLPGVRKLLNQL